MDWQTFNKTNVRRAFPASTSKHILAMRRDGKAYVGIVDYVTDNYAEISNGEDRQILYYNQAPMRFTTVEPPAMPSFQMADRRLPLDGE